MANTGKRRVPRGVVILRLDGKKFSKLTRPYKEHDEFSPKIAAAMEAATYALLREMDNVIAVYTVSDEISLVIDNTCEPEQAWYGARADKWFSVSASIAASAASLSLGIPANFDAKVFPLPSSQEGLEAAITQIWKRRGNGYSNAVSSYASRHLGHSTVIGVPTYARAEMLESAGVWVVPALKYGTLFRKRSFVSSAAYVDPRTNETVFVSNVERFQWIPELLQDNSQLDFFRDYTLRADR